jgi:hypothetical protein
MRPRRELRRRCLSSLGTRPGEVVGAPARCNNGFAAIEHARANGVGVPFIWMACGAQKFAGFFSAGRI